MKNKNLLSAVFSLLLIVSAAVPAHASAEGFAVYHNKAFSITPYWHSGVMITDTPEHGFSGTFEGFDGKIYSFSNTDYSVSHLSSMSNSENSGATVLFASFDSFLGSKDFTGYYTSVDNPSLSKRQYVKQTALKFYNYTVTYSAFNQIDYAPKNISYPGYYVEPTSITKFRCDGFVEYCFERNDCRLFGPKDEVDEWNIYHNCTSSRSVHNTGSLPTLSPEIQARSMKNMMGDIDADGSVTVEDSRLALRYAVNLETPNEYQKYVADVTGDDGTVSMDDARLIQRAAIGLEGNGDINNIGTSEGYRFPNDFLYEEEPSTD